MMLLMTPYICAFLNWPHCTGSILKSALRHTMSVCHGMCYDETTAPTEIMLLSPESLVSWLAACTRTSRSHAAFTHEIGNKETPTDETRFGAAFLTVVLIWIEIVNPTLQTTIIGSHYDFSNGGKANYLTLSLPWKFGVSHSPSPEICLYWLR